TLATGGLDNLVRVAQLIRGSHVGLDYAGPHVGPLRTIAVTPDGKTLGTGCDYSGIPLWDAAGRQIQQPNLPGNCLVFSPHGKLLASFIRGSFGHDGFRITLWEKAAGWDGPGGPFQQILWGHTKRVGAVCFTADGKTLLSWGFDGTFRHWDVVT